MMRRGQIKDTVGTVFQAEGMSSAGKDTDTGMSLVCSRKRKKASAAEHTESQGE